MEPINENDPLLVDDEAEEALLGALLREQGIDAVAAQLRRVGMLEACGGIGRLYELRAKAPPPDDVILYAHRVRDAARRRRGEDG